MSVHRLKTFAVDVLFELLHEDHGRIALDADVARIPRGDAGRVSGGGCAGVRSRTGDRAVARKNVGGEKYRKERREKTGVGPPWTQTRR